MEPSWNMMVPLKVPPRTTVTQGRSTEPPITTKKISANTSLSSHPTKQPKSVKRPKEIKIVDVSQKENLVARESNHNATEMNKTPEEQTSVTSPAPFGKLASKMKFMLRRRSTENKKKPKKEKEQIEVDRIESVHWTEM
jgi:pyruvate dehydrogenase phosphatase